MHVSYGQGDLTRLLVGLLLAGAYAVDYFTAMSSTLMYTALFIAVAMLISFSTGFCTSAFILEKLGVRRSE